MNRNRLLVGAAALASLAMAGGAHATNIFGGGSTLIGPYLRQAEDCYGNKEDLVVQGAYPYGAGSESFITEPYFDFTGSPAHQCSASNEVNPNISLYYVNAGSGNGELGVFTHDEGLAFGTTSDSGHTQATSVQYGAGDYAVGASEVGIYDNGGILSQTAGDSSTVGLGSAGSSAAHTYPLPVPLYGAFIQLPLSVDPVAIAFPSTYGETFDSSGTVTATYHLNIHKVNTDGSGGLLLDVPTTCAIFNGAITNLNDPALTALNDKVSLRDPSDPSAFNVPIQLAGRADSSGTTSIIYRALAAQCGQGTVTYTEGGDSYSYTNAFVPAGGKKLPSSRIGSAPGQFMTFTGTTAVAAYLSAPIPSSPSSTVYQFRLGYVGTDYTLPASTHNNLPYNLSVANIEPNPGKPGLEPTAANAIKAFGSGTNEILPPQSSTNGAYLAAGSPKSPGLRTHPEDWAEPISTTVSYEGGTAVPTPLADPDHNISGVTVAYPFVGTTNGFFNTCYHDPAVTAGLVKTSAPLGFLDYYLTSPIIKTAKTGLLAASGLSALPAAYLTAERNTFVNPALEPTATRTALEALNLNILTAGTGPASGTGSQCNAVSPGA